MLEIVPVEMEATQEVVRGLGEWAPCQKVSEELGYPASRCGRLLYLQKGDLLLVCTIKRGVIQEMVSLGLCGLPKARESTFPQIQPHWLPHHILTRSRHLPRLAWSCAQRSQNWLGSEDQYKLSWRLAAYRLLQIPESRGHTGESPSPRHHLSLPQGQSWARKHLSD